MLVLDMEGGVLVIATPSQNQLFTDNEQHDANLGNAEEAPDRGLFHEVGGDVGGKEGTSSPEEDSLNDHVLLHDKEGTEHQEGVDGSGGRPVGGVVHGHGPSKMVLALVGAQGLTTQPLSGAARTGSGCQTLEVCEVAGDGALRVLGQKVASQKSSPAKKAQTQNNVVLNQKVLALGQRTVDDVGEVGLVADVNKSDEGQELVHFAVTVINPKVLKALKQLHQKEPENTNCEASV